MTAPSSGESLANLTFSIRAEGGIEGMPSSGDTRVEFAVLRIYRRLDPGRLGSAGLSSIKWNRGGKIRAHPYRQLY
jgi:hypothetical protein